MVLRTTVRTAKATFPYWKLLFWVPFFKQLLLKKRAVDFVEICNVCTRKAIIKDAKRIFNSDKICRSYCYLYFGVTFFGTHCTYKHTHILKYTWKDRKDNLKKLIRSTLYRVRMLAAISAHARVANLEKPKKREKLGSKKRKIASTFCDIQRHMNKGFCWFWATVLV